MFIILARLFTGLSLLAPLLVNKGMFFPFISPKVFFFRLAIELALLFYLLHLAFLKNRNEELRRIFSRLKQPLVITVGIFAILFTLTALLGVNPAQSFWSNFERGEGAFQILHYALFFLLVVGLFPDRKGLERLALTQIVSSILISFYALGQLLGWQTKLGIIGGSERISGTLGNPSYLAAYLLFTFGLLLYFFLYKKSWRWWIILAGIFEFFIFFHTGTRGAILGFIVGFLTFFILLLVTPIKKKTKQVISGVLIASIGIIILFFLTNTASFWSKVPFFPDRFLHLESALQDFKPRVWTWGSAVSGVLERPLLGWGAENFSFAFDKYYNPNHFGIESFFDRTHNVFLEYAISGGVVLLLGYLAIFFFAFRKIIHQEKNVWSAIAFATLVAYLIQGLFLFDVLPIYLALFLFLALILNSKGDSHIPPPAYHASLLAMSAATGALLLIGTSLYATDWQPYRKNKLLTNAIIVGTIEINQPQPNWNAILNAYQAAIDYRSPVGQEEVVGMHATYTMQYIETLIRAQRPIAKEALRNAVDANNKWYDTYRDIFTGLKQPYLNGGLNLRTGLVFSQEDYLARGKKIYNEALAIAPTRIEFVQLLLEAARIQKDIPTFEELLAKAKQLRPDINWDERFPHP